jgi:hypothetical protein
MLSEEAEVPLKFVILYTHVLSHVTCEAIILAVDCSIDFYTVHVVGAV